jgi:hypothetical protein
VPTIGGWQQLVMAAVHDDGDDGMELFASYILCELVTRHSLLTCIISCALWNVQHRKPGLCNCGDSN